MADPTLDVAPPWRRAEIAALDEFDRARFAGLRPGWFDRHGNRLTIVEAEAVLGDPTQTRVALTHHRRGPVHFTVSTVLLVLDQNWGFRLPGDQDPTPFRTVWEGGRHVPLIFETLVISSDEALSGQGSKWPTLAVAQAGHRSIYADVRRQLRARFSPPPMSVRLRRHRRRK